MTLRQKVGQLFVINGYGESVQDTNPQMVAFNKQYYGVSTIKQLIQKYQPGGIIYFNWTNNLQSPPADRRALERHPAGVKGPMLDLDRPGAGRGASHRAAGNRPAREHGARRDAAARASRGRRPVITGQELRAMGINVDDAPVVDVNVNPLNEADGIRSFGDRPRRRLRLRAPTR